MKPELESIAGGDPVRQQAAAWFARLRSDDATAADTQRWTAWLEADPRHRSAYERLERLWSEAGEHAPHPEIARRLADGPAGIGRTGARRRWLFGLATAATLAASAIGAWALRPPAAADTTYATAVGEQRSLSLEDGTRVTLDTDTRLRVAYLDDERRMVLDHGRAFFRVAHEARPLSVRTRHGGVRVVGTAFELRGDERAAEVALIEGEVLLLPPEHARGPAAVPVRMVAGQRARLGDGLTAPRIEPLRATAAPAWLSGRLVFEDASLADAAAEFNRYGHGRIVLDGDGLSAIRITGVFRSDGAAAFAGALADAYPVALDASEPGVLRLRPAPDRDEARAP
ncbi:FecR family protein [Luteimonas huabeiensis]|uniref:FecR family protein n=1 Tax=Luteimonas huabeiensis TaxID=1244513 RepID=UPI0004652936|nr:FecR domain-containing protein [Luteimonas huabeiensis]